MRTVVTRNPAHQSPAAGYAGHWSAETNDKNSPVRLCSRRSACGTT